ncbi:MFS transporter [Microbacterium sp. NPDC089320]|uniref:MFS transporter n=1 Tax=Microbacterium sp. NPDC089320 TaxID=3155182 RepID=UPI003420D68C
MERDSTEAAPDAPTDPFALLPPDLTDAHPPRTARRMPWPSILVVLVAQLVISIALITPSTYSLAVWLDGNLPETKDSLLAFAIGASSLVSMLVGPVVGAISDRTRTRWGPRRTWLVAGLLIGTVGSAILVTTVSPLQLVVGWSIAAVGYGVSNNIVLTHLSDRLVPAQRGLVLGMSSAVIYVGPVAGVLIAGAVSGAQPLMFAIPAAAALVGGGLLAAVMTDPPLTGPVPRLPMRRLLDGFWFSPRRYPRFGWVWLNRAIFFVGVSFMTLYTVFFLSSALHLDPARIALTASLAGVIGIAASTLAGTVAGALSDRASSRLPFMVAGILLLCVGLLVIATSTTLPQYLVGTTVNALAMGVYSAVGQALQFDVLPSDDVQNGRYLAILGLAMQIPNAIGPFLAAGVLALGGGQYAFVYVAAAAVVAASILPLLALRRHRRAHASDQPSAPERRRTA